MILHSFLQRMSQMLKNSEFLEGLKGTLKNIPTNFGTWNIFYNLIRTFTLSGYPAP